MEFEGTVVQLGNTEVKIRNLLQNIHKLEDENRSLQSALQETKELLAAARERISRLLGEHAMAPKIAKAEHQKAVKASRCAAAKKRRKKPGDPKRTFSPEKLAALQDNMAKARQARSDKAQLRPET